MFDRFICFLNKLILLRFSLKVIHYNNIEFKKWIKRGKITINGKGNTIVIKQGNHKYLKIFIEGNNNRIYFGKNVHLRNMHIIIQGDNHHISIGEGTHIAQSSLVCCGLIKQEITIDHSCMCASGLNIKTCDGHTIYKNSKVLNPSKSIKIAHNVWIAENVTILKGAVINANSVVGYGSLVTAKEYEKNTIIAGFPAKVIQQNITWSKENIC